MNNSKDQQPSSDPKTEDTSQHSTQDTAHTRSSDKKTPEVTPAQDPPKDTQRARTQTRQDRVATQTSDAASIQSSSPQDAETEKDTLELPEEQLLDDNFWNQKAQKNTYHSYSKEEIHTMEKNYVSTLEQLNEKEVVMGTLARVSDKYAIINIGSRSDGLVHLSEFRDTKEKPQIGDSIEVFIEKQEDADGNLIISRRKAKLIRVWDRIQASHEKDEILEGKVKRRTKGGLIVDLLGIEAFLPGSQIDVKPIRDFDAYVNRILEVKVVKINYTNDNIVVSHKVLIEKDIEQQKSAILSKLEKGQVLEGMVKNITNFGAFIDLGGFDGLLHITDISWGRVSSPRDILDIDQKVNVVVLEFDDDKKRISLGMKQLQTHPWKALEDCEIGQKIKGKIISITDYGAFLEVAPHVEGLIHVSEMSWSQHLRSPNEFVKVGQEIEAVVLSLDREEYKMALGLKQLQTDPWNKSDFLTKYAVGTQHTGIARNLTNYGLFMELEEGVEGLVHISDLSWIKKIRHPSDFTKVGETLEVVVLEVDVKERRLSLSHRHLEPNPWDEFESIFARGSVHNCTVIKQIEKVAILELPYGFEGICYNKNLQKDDQSMAQKDETLPFMITDFSASNKRIVLSHTHTFQKPKHSGGSTTPSEFKAPTLVESSRMQQSKKSTLGELEGFSSLKEDLKKKNKKEEE